MENDVKIFEAIDSKEPAMISFLEKLVNIDSGKDNLEGIHQVASHIKDKLTEIGFDEVKLIETPNAPTHVFGHKKSKRSQCKKSNDHGTYGHSVPKRNCSSTSFYH